MASELPPGHPPRVLNPLWIIALFLGLSETTVGIAAAESSGWVQGLLAVFAVSFPLLVSTVFFLILWQRPEVLYAPGDFPEHVPISTYVDGMRRRAAQDPDIIQAVVNDTLRVVLPAALESPSDASDVLEEAMATAEQALAERVLTVDISPITKAPGDAYRCTVFSTQTVSGFLDALWADALDGFVRPFRYGRDWVLVDRQSKRQLRDLGSDWARKNGMESDERLLSGVGITPASHLVAVRLDTPRHPFPHPTEPRATAHN
ncbi:hypothetical protein ACFU5B_14900 [Streptomyces murinus]|uniref:hypothetical protein n=1 Tax=Streptomyces murinus TaxID=33900 RepID=UPI0036338551